MGLSDRRVELEFAHANDFERVIDAGASGHLENITNKLAAWRYYTGGTELPSISSDIISTARNTSTTF